jgi:signal peptidase I
LAAAPGRSRAPLARLAVVVLGLFAVLLVVRFAVAEPFSIPSDSMAPTLARGDHVVVDKLAYRGDATPRNGDVVVFRTPRTDEIALKRVVAQPGDTVGIEDGVLVVNGERRAEPYADADAIDSVYFGPVRVPRDAVFVLGDNRADSVDSRSHGPVPTGDVIGRARARIWPPSRWGGIG